MLTFGKPVPAFKLLNQDGTLLDRQIRIGPLDPVDAAVALLREMA